MTDYSQEKWTFTPLKIMKNIYTWRITDFTLKTGELQSPRFCVEGEIEFYITLNICTRKENEIFSANVHYKVINKRVITQAIFKICLLDSNSQERNIDILYSVSYLEEFVCSSRCFPNKFQLLTQKEMLLPNDVLTLRCEIGITCDSDSYNLVSGRKEIPKSKLIFDMFAILKNGNYSDFTLVVDKHNFRVHKTILAARSPVFAKMFQQYLEEQKENYLKIYEFDEKVVDFMLKFIYGGTLPVFDYTLFKNLLKISDRFQIEDLKAECENNLMWNLWLENVAESFLLAVDCKASMLQKLCLEFILKNTAYVSKTSGWLNYASNLPETVNLLLEHFISPSTSQLLITDENESEKNAAGDNNFEKATNDTAAFYTVTEPSNNNNENTAVLQSLNSEKSDLKTNSNKTDANFKLNSESFSTQVNEHSFGNKVKEKEGKKGSKTVFDSFDNNHIIEKPREEQYAKKEENVKKISDFSMIQNDFQFTSSKDVAKCGSLTNSNISFNYISKSDFSLNNLRIDNQTKAKHDLKSSNPFCPRFLPTAAENKNERSQNCTLNSLDERMSSMSFCGENEFKLADKRKRKYV